MSTKPDVAPTAEVIEKMAEAMTESAAKLARLAVELRESGSLEDAALAAGIVTNCLGNLRLDLLVTRPLRALERASR
ncbi:hypothetical protein [Cupriavidus pauculus]|uniref:hypothetical protein n=1 Tax=Cupriavidus pauculus TaxID=82633 RepID=UPI001D0C83AD|nr:hypothetical protein [Cupriavidus pauculus]